MLIMLLNDGETYTDLHGCKILHVNDDLFRSTEVDADSAIKDLDPAFVAVVTSFDQDAQTL